MDAGLPRESVAASDNKGHAEREFHSRYRRLWLFFVFFTAFVSLTPLVIMTYVNFYQYRKALRGERIHPIVQLTSTSRRFMDDFLKEHRAALSYVAKRESYEDLCNLEKLNHTLSDMKESFGGFVDLGIIDSDGNQRCYAGPHELKGKNYKEQDWFQKVRKEGVHVSDVFMGFRDLPHFVITVRKDAGENGGFYILRATID
ncbi:MAG: two-component sensor histidine kinase, partial [Candidatus Nealsonbacteria bacterium]|nr:two-component sensor histidine kinase [Candidatus Nealsonbacteria bacterium]